MEPIIGRLRRVLKMERGVFTEIGADPAATTQAIVVTIVASLIGGLVDLFTGDSGIAGWLIGGLVVSVVALAIFTGIVFLVSRMFKGQGPYIGLFRALGYASAPQALAIIPIVGSIVGAIWSIILAIRAVKETQSVTDGAAVAIVLIPVLLVALLIFILVVVVGLALLGLFAAAENS